MSDTFSSAQDTGSFEGGGALHIETVIAHRRDPIEMSVLSRNGVGTEGMSHVQADILLAADLTGGGMEGEKQLSVGELMLTETIGEIIGQIPAGAVTRNRILRYQKIADSETGVKTAHRADEKHFFAPPPSAPEGSARP